MIVHHSQRMQKIYQFIQSYHQIADIGTDHAYLCIAFCKQGPNKKAWAIDKRIKPLANAKKNIKKGNLQNQIILLKKDNLLFFQTNKIQIDACVIAGLGNKIILNILETDHNYITTYVLCPNGMENNLIRMWIKDHNYHIANEIIVKENNVFYEIIYITKEKNNWFWTELDFLCGPVLKQNPQNPLFQEKWNNYLVYLKEIIAKLTQKTEKYFKMKKKIKMLENILHIK